MSGEVQRPYRSRVEVDLLRALQRHGRQSRAALSRRLNVQRSTSTKIVRRLLENGTVRVIDDAQEDEPRAVGRPGQYIELAADHVHFLGVEIGVGYVRGLRLDLCGEVRATAIETIPVKDQTPERIVDVSLGLLKDCVADSPPVCGLAVALPGIIRRDGMVIRIPKLGWQDVPFGALLAPKVGAYGPLSLENDANAFAMGEMIRGGNGEKDLVLFLYIVSGLGGAIIDRGRFLFGQSGLAGEIGHIYVSRRSAGPTGAPERLEEIAGVDALVARYADLGGGGDSLSDLFTELNVPDGPAQQAVDEWISALAQALSSLTSVLNPGRIVIGGPIAGLAERVKGPLLSEMTALSMHGTQIPEIAFSHTAENAVAIGCAEIQRLGFLEGRQVSPDETAS